MFVLGTVGVIIFVLWFSLEQQAHSDTCAAPPLDHYNRELPHPPESTEVPIFYNEAGITVEVRPLTRTPAIEDPEGSYVGVAVDVKVVGTKQTEDGLHVLTDFDSGTIRLWQPPFGSPTRSFHPLGLCPGEHTVTALAVTPRGNLFANASATFVIGEPGEATIDGTNIRSSRNPFFRLDMLGYNIVTGTEAGKSCKLFERQPPLHGTQKEQGQRLCRVCPYALEEGHDRKPLGVTLKEPLEGNNKEPLDLFHPQPRRRLILSTSLRATFGGAKGTNGRTEQQYGAGAVERERLLQLREGDSPVSIARDFVANRLGFEVRHEGIERPIVAEPLGSDLMAADDGQQAPLEGKSCTFEGTSEGGQGQKRCSLQGGGGGARLVEWVTQTLEAEIAERKIRRSVARAEAATKVAKTGQLRIVLGAGTGEVVPVEGGWVATDVNTLDVIDAADFEYILGGGGLADAFLAEHVWEHLSLADAHRAARNCYRYLRPGGRLRLAVPGPAWFLSQAEPAAASGDDGVGVDLVLPITGSNLPTVNFRSGSLVDVYRDSDGGSFADIIKEGHTGVQSRGNGERNGPSAGRERRDDKLPNWLSREMLAADIRDGHLVQFNHDLLANVCWSAGFNPMRVEGAEYPPEEKFGAPTTSNTSTTAREGGSEGMRSEADIGSESADGRLWGKIKRSIAGGDPRGAVSIIVDCIKPNSGDFEAAQEPPTRITDAALQSALPPTRSATIGGDFHGHATQPTGTNKFARSDAMSLANPEPKAGPRNSVLPEDGAAGAVYGNGGIGGSNVVGTDAASNSGSSRGRSREEGNILRAIDYKAGGGGGGGGGSFEAMAAGARCRGLLCNGDWLRRNAAGLGEGGYGPPARGCVTSTEEQTCAPNETHQHPGDSLTYEKERTDIDGVCVATNWKKVSGLTATEVERGSTSNCTKSVDISSSGVLEGEGGCTTLVAGLPSAYRTVPRINRPDTLGRESVVPKEKNHSRPKLRIKIEQAQGGRITAAPRVGSAGPEKTLSVLRSGRGEYELRSNDQSPPPLLHFNNATVAFRNKIGLPRGRAMIIFTEDDIELSSSFKANDKPAIAIGDATTNAGGKGGFNVYRPQSLAEWATAAQKQGRMDPTTEDERVFESSSNMSLSKTHKINTDIEIRAPETFEQQQLQGVGVIDMRTRAREALLGGDVVTTLDICGNILQARPFDAVSLLYEGAALAQKGQWAFSHTNMERILALSSGSERDGGNEGCKSITDVRKTRGWATPTCNAQLVDSHTGVVPLDTELAAAGNLAAFARARAPQTRDSFAEVFFLLEGLRGATARATRAHNRERSTGSSAQQWPTDDKIETTLTGGFADIFIVVARALAEAEQLTAALRLYQRVVLLGDGHRDPRVIHGLGGLLRRLRQVERERREIDSYHAARASVTKSTTVLPETVAVNASAARRARSDLSRATKTVPVGCEWKILHPKSNQVFSPQELITVEFDLTLLNPGPPAAGSLFAVGVNGDAYSPAESVASSEGGTSMVGGDDVGFGILICSYLEGFQTTNCLPRGQLRNLDPGWHVLTAEAYVLPSLGLFRCADRGEGNEHSARTVRFCVGDEVVCGKRDEEHKKLTAMPEGPISDRHTNVLGTAETPAVSIGVRESAGNSDELTATRVGTTRAVEAELPFCFLTLALNAMPFITHHAPIFRQVGEILSARAAAGAAASAPDIANGNYTHHIDHNTAPTSIPRPEAFWEWHVVEGVAVGRADHNSPYSRRRIPDHYFDPVTGLSVDGTTEYLDEIREAGGTGEQIRVHRRCARHASRRRKASAEELAKSEQEMDGQNDACVDGNTGKKTCLWRDKIQMINTAIFSLDSECLLVQIDADELWTSAQLVELRDMMLQERKGVSVMSGRQANDDDPGNHHERYTNGPVPGILTGSTITGDVVEGRGRGARDPESAQKRPRQGQNSRKRECAYFDCHFFVGPDLVTVTEDGWGHSTSNEWLRAWVFRPHESLWLRHAPPELARHDDENGWRLLAGDACIGREETRHRGLVFTHYAYVLEEQVQFKSDFYGHSALSSPESGETRKDPIASDPVSEWRALQTIAPPFILADHLTWLRNQGRQQDPRLLETIVDRPMSYVPSLVGEDHAEAWADGTDQGSDQHRLTNDIMVVPLEPFLRAMDAYRSRRGLDRIDSGGRATEGHRGDRDDHADDGVGHCRTNLTHGVDMGMGKRKDLRGAGETTEVRIRSSSKCGVLHLIVDGVIFQVDAASPKGIVRVWVNVMPAMLNRLVGFEGTCVTLLVRGMGSPPPAIEKAFSGLPSDRFRLSHFPPYNPSFGFVSDQLMLSRAVRDAGGTAFVSTLYTQTFWATTPDVVRLLLVHDLLPEVFGWDTSKGAWLAKADAAASATAVVTVSQHSAREFLRLYPATFPGGWRDNSHRSVNMERPIVRPVWASHNGVDTSVFHPVVDASGLHAFRQAAGLLDPSVPYALIVGARLGYKNARTAYRAIGASTVSGTTSASASVSVALVLVGGGPVVAEELELLSGVEHWVHIGGETKRNNSEELGRNAPVNNTLNNVDDADVYVDDELLAAGYSGAVALLQLSAGEGFGLTVLEAFACGCPVVASDIPPFREIAGLPRQKKPTRAKDIRNTTSPLSLPAQEGEVEEFQEHTLTSEDRYGGVTSPLEGGLILVQNSASATQVWRAVRAFLMLDVERRTAISEALVRRARVFDSWQPLADTLVKAAVG